MRKTQNKHNTVQVKKPFETSCIVTKCHLPQGNNNAICKYYKLTFSSDSGLLHRERKTQSPIQTYQADIHIQFMSYTVYTHTEDNTIVLAD